MPRQPAPPPDPPQLPTIDNELPSAGQEESVEDCPTELPEPHLEADSLYLPSDASFLMMMDAQQNTACDRALSQHESSKSIRLRLGTKVYCFRVLFGRGTG
ncbi:unnamed protein product [Ixodes persulcatus]